MIQKTIAEVEHITRTLREALDEMEQVMEVLELAEVQQNVTEAELQSLRTMLNRLQRQRVSALRS